MRGGKKLHQNGKYAPSRGSCSSVLGCQQGYDYHMSHGRRTLYPGRGRGPTNRFLWPLYGPDKHIGQVRNLFMLIAEHVHDIRRVSRDGWWFRL
jgi:hypothetical protein